MGDLGMGAPLLCLQRASPLADMCKYLNCLFYQSARAATVLLTQGADWRPKAICQVQISTASILQTRRSVRSPLSLPHGWILQDAKPMNYIRREQKQLQWYIIRQS